MYEEKRERAFSVAAYLPGHRILLASQRRRKLDHSVGRVRVGIGAAGVVAGGARAAATPSSTLTPPPARVAGTRRRTRAQFSSLKPRSLAGQRRCNFDHTACRGRIGVGAVGAVGAAACGARATLTPAPAFREGAGRGARNRRVRARFRSRASASVVGCERRGGGGGIGGEGGGGGRGGGVARARGAVPPMPSPHVLSSQEILLRQRQHAQQHQHHAQRRPARGPHSGGEAETMGYMPEGVATTKASYNEGQSVIVRIYEESELTNSLNHSIEFLPLAR
jgi:hypothetical protein